MSSEKRSKIALVLAFLTMLFVSVVGTALAHEPGKEQTKPEVRWFLLMEACPDTMDTYAQSISCDVHTVRNPANDTFDSNGGFTSKMDCMTLGATLVNTGKFDDYSCVQRPKK